MSVHFFRTTSQKRMVRNRSCLRISLSLSLSLYFIFFLCCYEFVFGLCMCRDICMMCGSSFYISMYLCLTLSSLIVFVLVVITPLNPHVTDTHSCIMRHAHACHLYLKSRLATTTPLNCRYSWAVIIICLNRLFEHKIN